MREHSLNNAQMLKSDIDQIFARANRLRAVRRIRNKEHANIKNVRRNARAIQLRDFLRINEEEFEYLEYKLETLGVTQTLNRS